jgi:hypothetical protein
MLDFGTSPFGNFRGQIKIFEISPIKICEAFAHGAEQVMVWIGIWVESRFIFGKLDS